VSESSDIAVLIPALNEAHRIRALLEHLTDAGFIEIVVADGGSVDATVAVARSFAGVRCIEAERGRGIQLHAAVQASSAPVILILHADTMVPPDAKLLIHSALRDPSTAAGCFRLRFDQQSPLLSVYQWFSRFETGLTTFGDQAYFMRRSALNAAGGVPLWVLLEDVELRRRLRRVGRFVKLPAYAVTSARRFRARGLVANQARNLAVMLGYWMGIPVPFLAAFYGARTHFDRT
jgi:rSAM/selenodomain-associated transferase 2